MMLTKWLISGIFSRNIHKKGVQVVDNGYLRKPSAIEAFFIDLEECGCNMTFHYYLKLDCQPDVDVLNTAFIETLESHSGINLVFRNEAWYKSDSVPECEVRHIDCEDICSYKHIRLDHHKQTVNMAVLHMTVNDTWYLCFDFFHGVVDGRSGVQFLYDFFAVMNGETPNEYEFLLSNAEIVDTAEEAEDVPHKNYNFTVRAGCEPEKWMPVKKGEEKTLVLKSNLCGRSLASKISYAVGQYFSNKSAKMIIPVDVRRYAKEKDKVMFGNLFVPIFIEANTFKKANDIHEEIIDYVKHKPLLRTIAKNLDIYTKFPPMLRRAVIRFMLPIIMSSKKFIYCALVSPVGKIDSERLQNDLFEVEDVCVSFISFPFTAFSVMSVQFKGHTNTTIAWHSGRVPEKIATNLVESLDTSIAGAV